MIVYYLFSTSAVLFVLLQMVHTATPLTPEETVQLHEGKQVKALEHALKVQYVKEVRRQLAECYKVCSFVMLTIFERIFAALKAL